MNIHHLKPLLVALVVGASASPRAIAEDWGLYSIVPVSAPRAVLEVVDAGASEGALVSINKPAGTPNQKWTITPKEPGFFTLRPANAESLVLAAAGGSKNNGTTLELEKDSGQPWQRWSLTKHENGSYSLIPKHTSESALDDFGGRQNPGAQIDLWRYPNTTASATTMPDFSPMNCCRLSRRSST